MGATLPLAGPALYNTMGANWAGTFLAALEAICIPIPFVFYRYGAKIRMKSGLIRSMQEDKRRFEAKQKKAALRLEREAEKRAEAEVEEGAPMVPGTAVLEQLDVEKATVRGKEYE